MARPSVCPKVMALVFLWNYRTLEGNRERCVSYFTLRRLSKKCMGLPARPLPGRSLSLAKGFNFFSSVETRLRNSFMTL
jgi:hypothetical protein